MSAASSNGAITYVETAYAKEQIRRQSLARAAQADEKARLEAEVRALARKHLSSVAQSYLEGLCE